MNTFLTLIHTPAWLKASISADAPVNDLEYIQDLIDFREVDQQVADVAMDGQAEQPPMVSIASFA